jgi:chorismate synthase
MQVGPLSDDGRPELAAAEGGNKRATPITRVRPGHADLAGALKYGVSNDVRDVPRALVRPGRPRRGVAAGGVARAFLRALGDRVWSFTAEVGGVAIDPARATRTRGRGRRLSSSLPGPRRRGRDGRADRRRRGRTATLVGACSSVVVQRGARSASASYVHWDPAP